MSAIRIQYHMNVPQKYNLYLSQLQRTLARWQCLTWTILLLIMLYGIAVIPSKSQYIARITISGKIDYNAKTMRNFNTKTVEAILRDKYVAGVIVNISSPGGELVPSEALYRSLSDLRKSGKPVIAVVDDVAASGGYIASLACDTIIAMDSSYVGSIGVILPQYNISDIVDKLGIKVVPIRSGALKAKGSIWEPIDLNDQKAKQQLVSEAAEWFYNIVKERRGLSEEEMLEVSDGRIFFGKAALQRKLIDHIGTEAMAVSMIQKASRASKQLKIYDLYSPSNQQQGISSNKSSLSIENITTALYNKMINALLTKLNSYSTKIG